MPNVTKSEPNNKGIPKEKQCQLCHLNSHYKSMEE